MTAYPPLAALAAVMTLVLFAALGWYVYGTPGSVFEDSDAPRVSVQPQDGPATIVTVEQGAGARAIGGLLESRGIIRSGRLFEVLVGLTGVQDSLEAGDYEFAPGTPAIEAVHRIAEGRTASSEVTIPEGRRAEEVAEMLEQAGIVPRQDFLNALVKSRYSEPFLQQVAGEGLEGYLFPARYSFPLGATAEQVVATMLRGFQDNVAAKTDAAAGTMTLDQVVTLASIVEREAAVKEERPLIAGVFLNRLRGGIALEADPTVQFAVAQDPASVAQFGWWKKELTLEDLKFASPYNTYANPGLPPGPIASPGLAAVEAVLQPAQTEFLYFVAKADGTHAFASTLEEHLANVEQYQ